MDDSTDSGTDPTFLGAYGVLIVPPGDHEAGWLVTVAGWDDAAEKYLSSGEGPVLDDAASAMQEAARVLEWMQTAAPDGDLSAAWERLQRARAAAERDDDIPPRVWGRW